MIRYWHDHLYVPLEENIPGRPIIFEEENTHTHTQKNHMNLSSFFPPDKPSAPVGPLSVSDITADSVTLSWQPPESDGGTPVTKYFIEKCDAKRKSWNKVAEIESKNLTYVVPKLYEEQSYLFRVSAINAEGQGQPLQMDTEVVPKKPAGGFFRH